MVKQVYCLFRAEWYVDNEREVASKHLRTVEFRSQVPANSMVIGRYSVLPFYRELEQELALQGSRLINTWSEHRFLADALTWSGPGGVLEGMTPRSWSEWGHLPEGSYVLKGRTNSRKNKWSTHMFAPTRADIPKVAQRLWDDTLINEQGVIVREYVPLRQIDDGINGLPITNEWRTFWLMLDGIPVLMGKGFYWASHPEAMSSAYWDDSAMELACAAAEKVGKHAKFFVLDLAQTAEGSWIVIEVNDGQMSGLSCLSPEVLYYNLSCATSYLDKN